MKEKIRKLKKDVLEPNRFQYLDIGDSKLYGRVCYSHDKKDKIIKKLLEDKAEREENRHCSMSY